MALTNLASSCAMYDSMALPERGTSSHVSLFPIFAAVTSGWAFLVLSRIDSGMKRVHEPREDSYGISDLSGPIFGGPADLEKILEVWRTSDLARSTEVWRWSYGLIDVVLVAAYVGLLWYLLVRGPASSDPAVQATRSWHLPVALIVIEVLENILQLVKPFPGAREFLWGATRLKWLLLAVLVVLVIVVSITRVVEQPDRRQMIERRLQATLAVAGQLKIQLIALAVFALLLLVPTTDQAPDMLRRSVEDGWVLAAALVAVFFLSAVLYFSDASSRPKHRKRWTPPWSLLLMGVVLVGVSFAPHVTRLRAPGILLLAIYVVGGLAGTRFHYKAAREPQRPPDGEQAEALTAEDMARARREADEERLALLYKGQRERVRRMRWWIAAVPFVVCGLALGAAETDPAFFVAESCLHRLALVLSLPMTLAAVALAGLLVTKAPDPPRGDREDHGEGSRDGDAVDSRWYTNLRRGAQAVPVSLAIGLVFSHEWLPLRLGGLGVLAVSLAALVVVLAYLQRASNLLEPPRGLEVIGFHRIPMLTLLVVWVALAAAIDDQGPHLIRAGSRPKQEPARSTVPEALDTWATRCAAKSGPTPLVLVSASGGGIRAAYWTASVLDRLAPPEQSSTCGPADKLFVASGTSGGAVGLVGYSTSFDGLDARHAGKSRSPWAQFGEDNLAPTLAALFVRDLPAAFLYNGGYDRARALEDSWSRSNSRLDQPFAWRQEPSQRRPYLILNGTMTNGCRLVVSPFDLGAGAPYQDDPARCATGERPPVSPGALDAADLLCGRQIDRKTAALLSARFTYVSPSGALPSCDGTAPVRVVDGGYAENNGAQSLVDLYTRRLEPEVREYNADHRSTCIVPIYVHVSNGYQTLTPDIVGRRSSEVMTPLRTAGAVRGQLDDVALQRAKVAMDGDVGCDPALSNKISRRFFVIHPSQHPGVQAPLGWTLSRAARNDMDRQLSAIACDKPWQSHLHEDWTALTSVLGASPKGGCESETQDD
ncbi:hypothetical protein J7E91_30135 [Streptomyces sp. ISL-99]|uniref:hypothetical protein n=1 Tax=Streptomyces sp. ISL-99 TaxID=2819193 RepID=UPI001BEC00DA|nr:hypothetical protein [Streptomyces sp. ISL-99]MBT2529540.1 hypothetical protein [Streptomyces sp. ISL-99]